MLSYCLRRIKAGIKGLLFCSLCYGSIVSGYLCLFCPLLPVVFLSAPVYHRWADFVCGQWQKYPTALLKYLIGTKFLITGRRLDLTSSSLIVCNRRTRIDWLFLWSVMYEHGDWSTSVVLRFVVEHGTRHWPALGWVLQLCCHLFLQRDWSHEERTINRFANFYARMVDDYVLTLLMFPEGSEFNWQARLLSDQFAERHSLKKLNNVLYPHTTAFNYLIRKMAQKNRLANLYDFTIIYSGTDSTSSSASSSVTSLLGSTLTAPNTNTNTTDSKPLTNLIPQREFNLLKGEFPQVVIVRIDRYSIEDILIGDCPQPASNSGHVMTPPPAIALNLTRVWQQKDVLVDEMLRHHWLLEEARTVCSTTSPYDLIGSLIFWSALQPFALFMLYTWPFFGFLAVFQTAFLLSFNIFFGEFLRFEAFLCRLYFFERFIFFVIILLTYSCCFYLI